MPSAKRKIAPEYKILGSTPALGSSKYATHYLVEQAPTKKLYFYLTKGYYIPQPWTYYVVQANLVPKPARSYMSIVNIFSSTEKVKELTDQVFPPLLSNMIGGGHMPCCTAVQLSWNGKKIDDKTIVHDTYRHFWGQRGNSEGYEDNNSTFKTLASEAGYLSSSRARIFTWLQKHSIEDILAIDWPKRPIKQIWEINSIVKHFPLF